MFYSLAVSYTYLTNFGSFPSCYSLASFLPPAGTLLLNKCPPISCLLFVWVTGVDMGMAGRVFIGTRATHWWPCHWRIETHYITATINCHWHPERDSLSRVPQKHSSITHELVSTATIACPKDIFLNTDSARLWLLCDVPGTLRDGQ